MSEKMHVDEEDLAELQEQYDEIMGAVCAEDVFGPLSGNSAAQLRQLTHIFKKVQAVIDPANVDDSLDVKDLAQEAWERLKQFDQSARAKIQAGVYGQRIKDERDAFVIEADKRSYFIEALLAAGEISRVYHGSCAGSDEFAGQIVAKVVNDAGDNDLMANEQQVLGMFRDSPSNQSKHLPFLLDTVLAADGRQVNIQRRLVGGYTFEQVRQHPRWKDGVPDKHMVWMLNRILSAAGFWHTLGVVHANLDPSHFLLHPQTHNVWTVGWGTASIRQAPFKVFNRDFSPPEVQDKKPPLPATDLYSIGKCMIYILGGDIKTNRMPDTVDERLQEFINWFVLESPIQRPQDAWQMHSMLENLVVDLWGPKKYRVFNMD